LTDICRDLGVNKQTLYNWKKKYSGMDSSQLVELKTFKEEDA
jgi:putative transposase